MSYFIEDLLAHLAPIHVGESGVIVGAWGLLEHCIFLFQLIMISQKNTICKKVLTRHIHYIVSNLARTTLSE